MQIVGRNKWIHKNIQMPAGFIVVLICLIIITPLCGFLFNCGCTWPWDGLADYCNYFDEHAQDRCPWCASKWAGGWSVGLSISTGYLGAMAGLKPSIFPNDKYGEILIRVLIGLCLFLIVAASAGWISATVQNYNHFVFTIG